MDIENLSAVRRMALVAVVFNVFAILVTALLLPHAAAAILPIIALVLPLLTLTALDGVAERRLGHLHHA